VKSGELTRTARFSADASHQLKTPVAVLRAGLDELLTREEISAEMREEVSALVHQTFRLNSIIEDLLLLSRVDSGRLQLTLGPVDLTRLVETCLDDLQLLHEEDAPEADITMPPALQIIGDTRYSFLIVQNLIENAHKYGTKGETLRNEAAAHDSRVSLVVANRGEAIPRNAWEHIFERFHRGQMGENIPGHGLGLNLARQLARLHGGDLKVIRSDGEWTEFEATFRAATTPTPALAEVRFAGRSSPLRSRCTPLRPSERRSSSIGSIRR
jgi:signal transduction histidine kinase